MATLALRMAERQGQGVDQRHIEAALATHDATIQRRVAADTLGGIERGALPEADRSLSISAARCSDEQRRAVEHITGGEQIAAAVAFAGAGKSTMLAAARKAWERQGLRPMARGALLQGGRGSGGIVGYRIPHAGVLGLWLERWPRSARAVARAGA